MIKKQPAGKVKKRKNNPLAILVALFLIALSAPGYAAQTHEDWGRQTAIVQTDKFGFATEWGGLNLRPVHNHAISKQHDSFGNRSQT